VCLFYISTSSELSNNKPTIGREATGSHSDQRLVMSENGQAF